MTGIDCCVSDPDPGQRDDSGGEIVTRRENQALIDVLIDLLLEQDIGQVRVSVMDRQRVVPFRVAGRFGAGTI